MADVHTLEQRKRNMSAIRSKDTKPEKLVRSLAHRLGYRYRLHRKNLPGKPDLVFSTRRKIIFVHGCFFHMHDCRYGSVIPKTNADFWQKKRLSNVERDERNISALHQAGWEVLTIWECETKDAEYLASVLKSFLDSYDVNYCS